MNLVGKIFVVLILLMSIVFATFSIMVYATHRNWRDEVLKQGVGWKDRYRQKSDEAAQAKADRDNMALQLNAQTYATNQTVGKLETTIRDISKAYAQKSDDYNAKASALAANTDALHAAEKNVEDLTREVKNLRTEIAGSQRETDEQIKLANSLNDKLVVASGQLAVFKQRNDQLGYGREQGEAVANQFAHVVGRPGRRSQYQRQRRHQRGFANTSGIVDWHRRRRACRSGPRYLSREQVRWPRARD